jgi:AP2-associated kinase
LNDQGYRLALLSCFGCVGAYKRTHVTPKRNPPPPPREQTDSSSSHGSANSGDAPLGAFWVTQHAQVSQVADNRKPLFDEEPTKPSPSSKYNESRVGISSSTPGDRHGHSGQALRNTTSNTVSSNGLMGGSDTNLFTEPQISMKNKASQSQNKTIPGKDPFNSFVADFDANNLHLGTTAIGMTTELEAEVSSLKEQLKKTTLEKAEMTAKYEKLSAICRSQRQEIQELKRTVAETTPPPSSKVSSRVPEFGSQVLTLYLYLVQHICLSMNIFSTLH